jgi:hypothetical protein
MPSYFCIDCKREVHISRLDFLRQRCPDCDMRISRGFYQQNIPGGVTLFANTGDRLGHRVLTEVILRYYKEQNPLERVYYLSNVDTLDIWKNYNYPRANKIFWAETSNIAIAPRDDRVIHYFLARESSALADMGYYPQWTYGFEMTDAVDVSKPFVLLHLRNVHNNAEKNVTDKEAVEIFRVLQPYNCIIVGNDQPFYWLENDCLFENVRGILSENALAWLCRHENCIAMIGKDSGPLHVAAACGADVIGYGYKTNRHWAPKGTEEKITVFVDVNNEFERFIVFVEDYARSRCQPLNAQNAAKESASQK